jgi:hypothetical protein
MRVLLREHAGLCIGPNIKRPRSGRDLKVRRSRVGDMTHRPHDDAALEDGFYSSV